MNFLNRLLKKSKFPVTQHETKFAFTCGGIDYYEFADFNNMPAMRGMKTMVFYEEMRMKCTMEFLTLHTEAIDNLLQPKPGKGINIYEIKKLNDQLKQRLELAIDTELILKIASIVYFDAHENIEDYDFPYNARKVQNWKDEGGSDFFLQKPLLQLLPILGDFQNNFQMYSQVVERLNKFHLDTLLDSLPESRTSQLKNKPYFSAVVIPSK